MSSRALNRGTEVKHFLWMQSSSLKAYFQKMEVDGLAVYLTDGKRALQKQGTGRRWQRHWVPQDTVLGSGKCFLLKWVTEDVLNTLSSRETVESVEPGKEHETVYLCTFEGCGKVFPEASGLRKHAHVHGEKQYICHYEGCRKRFVDGSKLKRHFLIHTGEKHFICPFEGCGKAFSLDFNLRSHMRTHTGENYHVCPFEECGKRYAHEYKLKAHLRTYHDKEMQNTRENNAPQVEPEREREVIVPTKFVPPPPPPSVPVEKPFGCPFEGCSKRYIHEYKLNLHLKSAHMVHDAYEDGSRPGRASESEEDVEEGADQDVAEYEEPGLRYYEQPPSKVTPNPPSKKRGGSKASSKGRNLVARNDAAEDSEETEDDNENMEEEDDTEQMAGRSVRDDDDEETEDDMD
ncbi:hypothetical protein R1flu_009998 [Riccia fluitans]|uniref:C2H2-type domain-containing protein n=1 Tax=Riccia fluitans TaxID=41844 RepID=A0ABD1Z3R2_9MARC